MRFVPSGSLSASGLVCFLSGGTEQLRACLEQDAEPQLMEPDKCSGWQWVHWLDVPKPVFAPLQQLLRSVYSPLHGDGVSGLLVR